jgi:acetylornithine/succinyldiaminopimelate/putrescine aminotransferase
MTTHAKLSKGITLTTIEGKRVLFSIRNGETYGLNETAAAFLDQLLATDLASAANACAAKFDAPLEEIRGDMKALADELSGLGLIAVGK